jgi:hypothetical protein
MGQFTTTPTTLTTTNVSPLQMDNAGNLLVNIKAGASSGAVAQGSTTSGQTGGLTQAAVTTASPTYVSGQTNPLSLDTTGALRVNVTAGGAGGGIVTQATAANLNATVVGTGTFVTQSTLAAETTKVIGTTRTVGNVGGVLDAIGQNVTAPANWLQAGCQFTTSPTTITTGNGSPLSCDNANNLNVNVKTATGLAQGSTTSGQTGSLVMGAASTNAPTATTADTWPLSISPASGGLRIDLKDTAANTNPFLTNVNQINGVTPLMGNGTTGTGSPRVTIASDNTAFAVNANMANVGGAAVSLGSKASSASIPVVMASDQTAADPCMFQAKTNVPISTATGTVALVAGVSAKKVYVCSLSLVTTTAVSVSLSEGSGATCGTSAQAGVIGVSTAGTAANGLPLAANGGLTLGNGGGTIAATATAANYLCLFQSGTAQIAGNITYVQQ